MARLAPAQGYRSIPPLFDVTLIGTAGERWVYSGFEHIEAGPLAREYAVGQTWIVEPVAVQDLIYAETKWGNAVREANELRERLRALTGADDSLVGASC